jgi:hypothetical protein
MYVSRLSATIVDLAKEGNMSLKLLALDFGKRSFHIHGVDSDGVVVSRKTSRCKLIETIEEPAPGTIAMEPAPARILEPSVSHGRLSGTADQSPLRDAVR